jgi:hypothetical protein
MKPWNWTYEIALCTRHGIFEVGPDLHCSLLHNQTLRDVEGVAIDELIAHGPGPCVRELNLGMEREYRSSHIEKDAKGGLTVDSYGITVRLCHISLL